MSLKQLEKQRDQAFANYEKEKKKFEKIKESRGKELEKIYKEKLEPLKIKAHSLSDELCDTIAKNKLSQKTMDEKLNMLAKLVKKIPVDSLSDDDYFDREWEQAQLLVQELQNEWDFQE